MKIGKMHRFGEVILSRVNYTDNFQFKKRPSLVLFEEKGNIVVLGITSNLSMEGVKLTKEEGAIKESIIKLNYIFTISEKMVEKNLFSVSEQKKLKIKQELISRIN